MVKKILINIPGQIVPAGIMFITSIVFTRILQPEDLSTFYILQAVIVIVKLVFYSWLSNGIQRFLPVIKNPDELDAFQRDVNKVLFKICCFLIICLIPIIIILKVIVHSNDIGFMILLILSVLGIGTFETIQAVFQSELRIELSVLFKITNSVLMFTLRILPFLLFDYADGNIYIYAYTVSYLVLIPFMFQKIKKTKTIDKNVKNPYPINDLLKFGIPMSGWVISSTVLSSSDRFMIKFFLTDSDVGIYSSCYNLINSIILLLFVPITQVMHPYLMKLSLSNDDKDIPKALSILVSVITMFSLFVLLGTINFSELISFILGDEFREGYNIMPIVLAGLLCWILSLYVHKPIEIYKKSNILLIISVSVSIINIILNWFFIPIYGYIAAAWTTLVSYLLYIIIIKVYSDKYIKVDWNWILLLGNVIVVFLLAISFNFLASLLIGKISLFYFYFIQILIYIIISIPYFFVNIKIIFNNKEGFVLFKDGNE